MPRFNIEAGNRFVKNGDEMIVIEIQRNKHVLIENIKSGERSVIHRSKFEVQFLSGEIILTQITEDQRPLLMTPLELLTDEQKAEVDRRLAYVEALEDATRHSSIRSEWASVVDEVSQRIHDPNPPRRSALCDWRNRWIKSGMSPSILAPFKGAKGKSQQVMTAEVRKLLHDLLEEHYLNREQETLELVLERDIFPGLEAEYNKRAPEDRFQIPSRATIYRYVGSLDKYEVALKREGKTAADQKYRYVGAGIKVDAPLDLVLFDHTVLDIQVLSAVEGFIARPVITVALDLKSRLPVGIYVGFVSPSYESVMYCLKQAIQDKSNLLAKFPSIQCDYQVYGLPRKILLDNAMEFHSNSLLEACKALGVDVVYHPVRSPHYKGAVERFFRTLNDGLLAGLKGRTFSNIAKKGDYDPVKNAVIPMAAFEEALFKWVVDVYARRFHNGIQDLPIQAWDSGVEKFPVDLPQNPDDLKMLLGIHGVSKLQQSGIHLNCTRYVSPELHELFKAIGTGSEVQVKVDPNDLGSISVLDARSQKYIQAVAVEDMFQGLSLHSYKMWRAEVNAKKKAGKEAYPLAQHLRDIKHLLEQGNQSKKKRVSRKTARTAEDALRASAGKKVPSNSAPAFTVPDVRQVGVEAEKLRKKAAKAGWSSNPCSKGE